MTELTQGMFKVIASTSLGRALVYTAGHVIIAMNVVYWLTGASLFEAGLVALVEPITINNIKKSPYSTAIVKNPLCEVVISSYCDKEKLD